MKAETAILAFDPAKNTGWAWTDGKSIESGEVKYSGDEIHDLVRERPCTHLIVEDGYVGKGGRFNRKQYGDHCKRVGGLVMAVRQEHPSCRYVWVPKPGQWRAVLRGFGMKMALNPRAQCKMDALAIARDAGRECRGPRGGNLVDEADAVCILLSGCLRWGLFGKLVP